MDQRRFEGKVALVTGAARGQGRAHALRLAGEGADVVLVDLEGPAATGSELAQAFAATVADLEGLGATVVAGGADVREVAELRSLLDPAVADLGRLDVVVANAGVVSISPTLEEDEASWERTLGVNVTGVWNTCRAALPHLIDGGRGGSIVITGSTMAVKVAPQIASYATSKHGVVGLAKVLALEFAPHSIRVNVVHPTVVDSPMLAVIAPDGMDRKQLSEHYRAVNALPTGWVQPEDIATAAAFLASDEARFITGAALPVDAGALLVSGSPR
jgi:SDR family mycofactocin-dependent oxidoreductase